MRSVPQLCEFNPVEFYNQITLIILCYIISRLVALYNSLLFFYLTVSFNFLNFSCQICLLLVPEMSASYRSYTVHIIYIVLTWIMYPLHFSLLPLI